MIKLVVNRKSELIALRKTGKTHKEIAELYNVTRQYIHQLIGGTGRIPPYPKGYKKCYGYCKKIKTLQEFYKPTHIRCIPCAKERARFYMEKDYNKEKYRKGGKYFDQTKARSAVRIAISKGQLMKPEICQINNGCRGRIEGHHYLGYERENWLKVKWLCTKHHQIADKSISPN